MDCFHELQIDEMIPCCYNESKEGDKCMKAKKRAFVAIIVVIALVLSGVLIYGLSYRIYWGRRHAILYDVKTISIQADKEKENLYYLTLDVDADTWFGDFKTYHYTLHPGVGGDPGFDVYDCNNPSFTLDHKGTNFRIECTLDIKDLSSMGHATYKSALDEFLFYFEFIAKDEAGHTAENASLYMNDNRDAEIIYIY